MLVRNVRMLALLLGLIAVMSVLDGCVVSGFSARGSSTCAVQEAIGSPCDARDGAGLSRGGKGDGGPENGGLQNVGRPVGGGSDTGDDGEDTGDDQDL
jgi:hypothetical protein